MSGTGTSVEIIILILIIKLSKSVIVNRVLIPDINMSKLNNAQDMQTFTFDQKLIDEINILIIYW